MLLFVWAYKPSSWATVAVGGCDNICFLLASQCYGSVFVYVCAHLYSFPSYCTAYRKDWILAKSSSSDQHLNNIQVHAFPCGSLRLVGLKHPCKQKEKKTLFLLFLPCCCCINELSLPHIRNSAGRSTVLLGVLSFHIFVKNLYLFHCHKIY